MNSVSRGIWFLVNVFFGAPPASTFFYWIACDMQTPLIITNFVATHAPIFSPLFNGPYMQIDSLASSVVAKLVFNAFLFAIFGFVHTFFAQEFVQLFLRRVFPQQTLRTVYCLLVTITVFLIMGFWQHTHIQLWNFLPTTMSKYQQQFILLVLYNIVFAPGWYVLIKFNPFEFSGMTQIFDNLACPYASPMKSEKRTTGNQTLITSGLFRLCRHPLALVTLLAFAITPVMSLDRLMIIMYSLLYLLIGVPIEERKLVQIFGQDYVDYQQRVPAIIPFLFSKAKQN